MENEASLRRIATWTIGRRLRSSLVGLAVLVFGLAPSVWGQETGHAIEKLPYGSRINRQPPTGWTHTLLVSVPSVDSGDLRQVSTLVTNYAEMLSLVIVARIEPERSEEPRNYQLRSIGVGMAIRQGDDFVVVTGDDSAAAATSSDENPPPRLDMLQKQVVRGASNSLDQMRVVARRTTLILFDSPAVVRLQDRNQSVVMRNLIWVESSSGRIGNLVWLLQPDGKEGMKPALDEARFLPPPFLEQRSLYVDSSQFTLGIPSSTAFALTQLPAGDPVPLSGRLTELASLPSYEYAQLAELASGLTRVMQATTRP
jgi:hypothetical protein